jgi:hypothetical protein
MENRDEMVATFVAVTGSDEKTASTVLESSNWKLEQAVNLYLHQGSNSNPSHQSPMIPFSSVRGHSSSMDTSPLQQQQQKQAALSPSAALRRRDTATLSAKQALDAVDVSSMSVKELKQFIKRAGMSVSSTIVEKAELVDLAGRAKVRLQEASALRRANGGSAVRLAVYDLSHGKKKQL